VIASSPSYFRGFTLIALREGAEGDRHEDYAGNFQVRLQLKISLLVEFEKCMFSFIITAQLHGN